MKIFNILPSKNDEGPVWLFMPDSTVLRSGNPFFVPEFDDVFVAHPALAVKINRLGKSIAPRFVHRYFCEATFAMTVEARNLLGSLQAKGLPWTPAVCFDKSCHLGDFIDFKVLSEIGTINLHIGDQTFENPLGGIMNVIEKSISAISSDTIIKTGDVFLFPLLAEGIDLTPGINITAAADDKKLLEIRIK